MRSVLVVGAALAVGMATCGPKNPKLTVADSEIVGLSAEQRAPVEEAKSEIDAADESLRTLTKERDNAKRESEVAEQKIKAAEAELSIKEMQFEAAQDSGNADEMVPAKEGREKAKTKLVRAEAEHKFRVTSHKHLSNQVEEGEAALFAAKARYELAKFDAVSAANSASGAEHTEQLAKFQAQVAQANLKLAERKTDSAKARVKLEEARKARDRTLPQDAMDETKTEEMKEKEEMEKKEARETSSPELSESSSDSSSSDSSSDPN